MELLDAYGSLLAELGDAEEAEEVLSRSIALAPEAGHEKYLYLGQMLDGPEALSSISKGVQLLQKAVQDRQEAVTATATATGSSKAGRKEAAAAAADERQELRGLSQQLCCALCAQAECQLNLVEEVEQVAVEVEALLQQARAMDDKSPEPLQALASMRSEQGQQEEALQLLRQSMLLWYKKEDDGDDDDDDDDNEEDEDEDEEMGEGEGRRKAAGAAGGMEEEEEEDEGPSHEFRFECCKLLLELDESTDVVVDVLEGLVEEDDSNPDVWHMLGLAYYAGQQLEEAREVVVRGVELLKKLGMGEEEEICVSFRELQAALEEAGGAEGAGAGAAGGDDMAEDEQGDVGAGQGRGKGGR